MDQLSMNLPWLNLMIDRVALGFDMFGDAAVWLALVPVVWSLTLLGLGCYVRFFAYRQLDIHLHRRLSVEE